MTRSTTSLRSVAQGRQRTDPAVAKLRRLAGRLSPLPKSRAKSRELRPQKAEPLAKLLILEAPKCLKNCLCWGILKPWLWTWRRWRKRWLKPPARGSQSRESAYKKFSL